MKIISYNLNGVRAAAKNGLEEFINSENSDFYCFQETRATKDQIESLIGNVPGYFLYSKEGNRKGYSGVAILAKEKPIKIIDNCFAFDEEGRILVLEYSNFVIIDLYVPNGATRLEFKLLFLDKFLRELKSKFLGKKEVIICTDFNISYSPLDLSNPQGCKNTTGYLKEEREKFTDYLDSGLYDSFRELNRFAQRFTWSSYGAKKINNAAGNLYTFDYIFVTENIKNRLLKTGVLLQYNCSDHYPVYAIIQGEKNG